MDELLEHISLLDIISACGVVVAIALSLRKAHSEVAANDGEASESYARAAATYAEELLKVRSEITALRDRIDILEKENRTLKKWAESLCAQLREAGIQPIDMKKA